MFTIQVIYRISVQQNFREKSQKKGYRPPTEIKMSLKKPRSHPKRASIKVNIKELETFLTTKQSYKLRR